MDKTAAITGLAALAQPTRLDAFRLLVSHAPGGLPAGEVARGLGVPHNTLSTHLGVLEHAGLISSERRSRSMIYRADLRRVQDLVGFLLKDCCQGRPEVCVPIIADLTPCCTPKEPLDA
jgi:ArsR family transcriptional regulator